jgi:hypothetical protein
MVLVVPAKAGIDNHRQVLWHEQAVCSGAYNKGLWLWVLGQARDDG